MKMYKELMKKKSSDPDYDEWAEQVKQFEAQYGEDWESTMIEYSSDFVSLPKYVAVAADEGNVRTALQWLSKGNIKERVNAKCHEVADIGLLWAAATNVWVESTNIRHAFMSYLLLNGLEVNMLGSGGASVLSEICFVDDSSKTIRLLLSWGAELFLKGKQMAKEQKLCLCDSIHKRGNVTIANLMSSELGGRRCEIVSAPSTRGDLAGKTCVVEEYIKKSDQYKVTMEFTNELLLIGVDGLKRRDRTPQDPGYYVECKNNKLIRHDFKSNEECQAFIANISVAEGAGGCRSR